MDIKKQISITKQYRIGLLKVIKLKNEQKVGNVLRALLDYVSMIVAC